jgi:hypothetical protein
VISYKESRKNKKLGDFDTDTDKGEYKQKNTLKKKKRTDSFGYD